MCDPDVDEKKELRHVFDEIAEEFSESRQEPWQDVLKFIEGLDGEVALDLGCGNGRHLPPLRERFGRVIGIDFSRELLDYASMEGEVVQAEFTEIPFVDSCADTVLFVAGLHHLPSHKERLASLNEVGRVLRNDGYVLVSVWAIEHSCFDGVRDKIRDQEHDYYVSWGEYERYYHIYSRDRFQQLLEECDLSVEEVWLSNGNYYAVLRGFLG